MNCRDLTHLVEGRSFGSLTKEERYACEAHAQSCHHCAPAWVAYARLAVVRIPPMPPDLAVRCRTLASARTQGSVLRFVPRGMTIVLGAFVVLAAAAGAITVHLVNAHAPQPREAEDVSLEAVTQVAIVQPPAPQYSPGIDQVESGEPAVAAVVLDDAASAHAQTTPSVEPQHKTAEEIIAINDLNRDGIVTREEAAIVNGNLYFTWNAVYDMDHDDRVDLAELKRAITEVQVGTALVKLTGNSGGYMAGARPEAILANNDLDEDGVVTREEAKKAGKALIRMWHSYDLNKDGTVEFAELAKAQGY